MSAAHRLAAVSGALVLALLTDAPADARKFQMSGTWVYRTGGIFFPPLQFASGVMDPMGPNVRVSMGDLTYALGFPNGPIQGGGGVSATGSAPATLRIPAHRFVEDAMVLSPRNGLSLVQITTNVGIDAPFAPATLAPGLGPGSFTWCLSDAGCVAGGGMRSTDPPGTGRVVYLAGAHQFGGAMQLGLRRGGTLSSRFNFATFQVGHVPFAAPGSTLRPLAVGGAGSADAPVVTKEFLPPGFATQPTIPPAPFSPILHPGPKVTTMFGTTLARTGPVFYYPTVGAGPMGSPVGQSTARFGFGQTTGTVLVQNTGYSWTFFTVMGSDARTPLGAGNLSLAAGGVVVRHARYGIVPFVSFQNVSLTLAPPIPSLSPAGLVAAATLVLLGVGYALRRRVAAP